VRKVAQRPVDSFQPQAVEHLQFLPLRRPPIDPSIRLMESDVWDNDLQPLVWKLIEAMAKRTKDAPIPSLDSKTFTVIDLNLMERAAHSRWNQWQQAYSNESDILGASKLYMWSCFLHGRMVEKEDGAELPGTPIWLYIYNKYRNFASNPEPRARKDLFAAFRNLAGEELRKHTVRERLRTSYGESLRIEASVFQADPPNAPESNDLLGQAFSTALAAEAKEQIPFPADQTSARLGKALSRIGVEYFPWYTGPNGILNSSSWAKNGGLATSTTSNNFPKLGPILKDLGITTQEIDLLGELLSSLRRAYLVWRPEIVTSEDLVQ
jgi:hypothetical protein